MAPQPSRKPDVEIQIARDRLKGIAKVVEPTIPATTTCGAS
jgi:hypothetical protein